MLPRRIARLLATSLAVLSLGDVARPALAQVFDFDKDREPMVLLDGLWRFHPGDDPHWADPDFDDSHWALISSTKSWSEQGYKDMDGTAWYRVKVRIPKGEGPLSLYVPFVLTSYQAFADGKLLGGRGGMPPNERASSFTPAIYAVPRPSLNDGHVLSIAIRIWHWPYWAKYNGGGIGPGLQIGRTHLIQEKLSLQDRIHLWRNIDSIVLITLYSLAGLSATALFAFRPQEKEYLWFGVAQLLNSAGACFWLYVSFYPFGILDRDLIANLLSVGETFAEIAFYFRLLQGKRDWFFWLALGPPFAWYLFALPAEHSEWISVAFMNALSGFSLIPVLVWMTVLLTRRAIQGIPDARVLLAPFLISYSSAVVGDAIWAATSAGWYSGVLDVNIYTWQWPFPFNVSDVASVLFLLAMLAILIRRFTRTRRQEERFASELEAARIVQQVLIPAEISAIPGFAIASVYKPASQVGGDFFQIIPTRNGGVLVLIGDVSGKGMPAAMTVSLLVGTVRTLAHYTQSPGEILAAMNQRMLARSAGGFTTCLVLRIDRDGALTVANAGHLAPYRNLAELKLENGLPLGLDANTIYPEAFLHLAEGEQLTLLTDGVVEARGKSGELFGFERTSAVATESAESIAQAALDFGQEDDITVLTITRVGLDEVAVVQLETPLRSPSLA